MIVTLTDFGNSEYLGIMKGVILSVHQGAQIVDLFQWVRPQCVREGAWVLLQSYQYFPRKSVFLCVVDPGVGGKRKGLMIKTKNYFFVGPDNGLMYPAALSDGIISVQQLDDKDAHPTFHGRDVFAPAAAILDKSGKIVGRKIKEIEKLYFPVHKREGEIVQIDHFGNIITNLPPLTKKIYTVFFGNRRLEKVVLHASYHSAGSELILVVSSYGTLELAVKNGSACKKIPCVVGEKIRIE